MCGDNYARDVYGTSSSDGWDSSNSFGASSVSTSKLSRTTLHPTMNPVGKVLKSTSKHPIVIMLDVTGSNTNFARVVYDKFPMFYDQIISKGYLDDFEISICAVGDANSDNYPLQVGDFTKGEELDKWMEKLVLEGKGGGQEKESYELAAYYLLNNSEFVKGAKPMVFFIGDEAPYPEVNMRQAEEYGVNLTKALTVLNDSKTSEMQNNIKQANNSSRNIKTSEVFKKLREKFDGNVFMFLNKYYGLEFKPEITEAWTSILGEGRTRMIEEEKSIVDLMLGAIALVSRKRTLKTYVLDMIDRGQTPERIANVSKSLGDLEKALVPVVKTQILPTKTDGSVKKSDSRGMRL